MHFELYSVLFKITVNAFYIICVIVLYVGLSLHRGAPFNVPIRRMVHCFNITPAYVRTQIIAHTERRSNLESQAKEVSALTTALPSPLFAFVTVYPSVLRVLNVIYCL